MPESNTESADKRVQRSKEAVLGVTYKLLSEGGIGGVSIDEVSRRSGVSKTTIYRHWPSRSALLLDACSKIGTPPEVPNTGSLLGDVTALATHLADQLQNARWPAVLPSIIDAAERDSELAQLHAGLLATRIGDDCHGFAVVRKEPRSVGNPFPIIGISSSVFITIPYGWEWPASSDFVCK